MGEGAFWSEGTLGHFPVAANLRLELLLEVRLRCHDLARLHGDNVKVGETAYLVVFLVRLGIRVLGVFPAGFSLICVIVLVKFKIKFLAAVDNRLHVHIDISHLPLRRVVD